MLKVTKDRHTIPMRFAALTMSKNSFAMAKGKFLPNQLKYIANYLIVGA